MSAARFARIADTYALVPGACVIGCCWYWLALKGVPAADVAVFLLVQTVSFVLPGTLLWTTLRAGRDPGVVSLVLGTVTMHAAVVPWYLLVRDWGHPRMVWVLPASVVGLCVVLATRRRGRRRTAGRRVRAIPRWCAWNGAAAVAVGVSLIAPDLPRTSDPGNRWLGLDYTYLLSLAGEVKHHVPPTTPFVAGESLDYHWFAFADMASTSWMSGRELAPVALQLQPILTMALGLAAFGIAGWKITGSGRGGVLSLWLGVLVGSVNVFGGVSGVVVDDTLLMINWIGSSTQGFAQMLAAAAWVPVADLLRAGSSRNRRPRPADWLLVVVLTATLSGGKATFIPVLGAGAAVALAVALLRRRGRITALALGVILAAELVFAQVVLFHGASQGITVGPGAHLQSVQRHLGGIVDPGSGASLLLVLAALLLGWVLPLLGLVAVVLLPGTRRRLLTDPVAAWITGTVLAGMSAVLLLDHPGFSQYFFLRAGLPFAYPLLVVALLALWDVAEQAVRRTALVAVGAGLAGCLALRAGNGPTGTERGMATFVVGVLGPLALLALAAGCGRRRASTDRWVAALLVASTFALGMGAARVTGLAQRLDGVRMNLASGPSVPVPYGGIAAARFVRAHSGPDELIATNAHCYQPRVQPCMRVAAWISAWAERRTVVQGWGYTARANRPGGTAAEVIFGPFWDQELLATNDRVFTEPTPEALHALLARYRVHWLVVDRRFPADLAALRGILPVKRKFGEVTVFDATRRR